MCIGGPQINTRGEVAGINSQLRTGTGGYEGVLFTILIGIAYRIEKQKCEAGQVHHEKPGMAAQDVDQALAESFKLEKPMRAPRQYPSACECRPDRCVVSCIPTCACRGLVDSTGGVEDFSSGAATRRGCCFAAI